MNAIAERDIYGRLRQIAQTQLRVTSAPISQLRISNNVESARKKSYPVVKFRLQVTLEWIEDVSTVSGNHGSISSNKNLYSNRYVHSKVIWSENVMTGYTFFTLTVHILIVNLLLSQNINKYKHKTFHTVIHYLLQQKSFDIVHQQKQLRETFLFKLQYKHRNSVQKVLHILIIQE